MADDDSQFQIWLKERDHKTNVVAHGMWAAFFRKTVRAIQDSTRAAVDEAYTVGRIDAELADRIEADIAAAIEDAINRSIASEVAIEYPSETDDGDTGAAV